MPSTTSANLPVRLTKDAGHVVAIDFCEIMSIGEPFGKWGINRNQHDFGGIEFHDRESFGLCREWAERESGDLCWIDCFVASVTKDEATGR